ncbi:MAG: SUF system NifU family Fe-S cluster assembly protein [Gemmatimonadetes bacterium]|nr:SUF system NifU family Fe-S cluster assembly protein [Gemmatimonadota bacterium]
MTDLQELYQSVILDHNRAPRNFGALEGATRTADGRNPLCGDEVHVALRVADEVIADVRFTGHGCAISKASASLMTAAVKGKSVAEAEALFRRFHALVTGQGGAEGTRDLGQLVVFSGVSRFPARVKCASLPWHALRAALAADDTPGGAAHGSATTE